MLFQSERTESEVNALEVNALEERMIDYMDEHGSKYPGMTYEDGALAMLEFLDGRSEANDIYEK